MSSRIADVAAPPRCNEMIRAGANGAINTSAGKDSQAMTILLSRMAPPTQLVPVLSRYRRKVTHMLDTVTRPRQTAADQRAFQLSLRLVNFQIRFTFVSGIVPASPSR